MTMGPSAIFEALEGRPLFEAMCQRLVVVTSYVLIGIGHAALLLGQTTQTVTPIFRHINIAPCGRLELGQVWHRDARAVAISATTYRVVPGCFGGADRIDIDVSVDGTIQRFTFHYSKDRSYDVFLRSYTQLLGPALVTHSGENERSAIWEDGRTRFRLTETLTGSAAGVSSRLENADTNMSSNP